MQTTKFIINLASEKFGYGRYSVRVTEVSGREDYFEAQLCDENVPSPLVTSGHYFCRIEALEDLQKRLEEYKRFTGSFPERLESLAHNCALDKNMSTKDPVINLRCSLVNHEKDIYLHRAYLTYWENGVRLTVFGVECNSAEKAIESLRHSIQTR